MKRAQTDSFMKERADLLEKGSLSNKSSLQSLNPFLDRYQLLRVGSRLENSDLTFDQQHPLILPKGHHITTIIVEDIHKKNLHASGQLLLSLIRQKFWIPNARNVLRKITQKCLTCFRLKATTSTERISSFATQQGINFHFIPPCASHMGLIWEAGVKSMKFHLRGVVGNAKLTVEKFYTLLCQVEAVLNSRPLCPLSNDRDNLQVLTPGHFLIGISLLALPDHNLIDLSSDRLSRWSYVQQVFQ
jgi:hypothetical protein